MHLADANFGLTLLLSKICSASPALGAPQPARATATTKARLAYAQAVGQAHSREPERSDIVDGDAAISAAPSQPSAIFNLSRTRNIGNGGSALCANFRPRTGSPFRSADDLPLTLRPERGVGRLPQVVPLVVHDEADEPGTQVLDCSRHLLRPTGMRRR